MMSLTNEKARFWLIMFICNCYTLNSFRVTIPPDGMTLILLDLQGLFVIPY